MNPKLIAAVIAITLALIFYTTGVFAEHKKKELQKAHVLWFWAGLLCDTTGTVLMRLIAGSSTAAGSASFLHGLTGGIAIVLMLFHAIWAVVVLKKNRPAQKAGFHRFSIAVWAVWLIPYLLGMVIGMR